MPQAHRLHPAFVEVLDAVFNEAAEQGISVRITSSYRSIAEQKRLFARFGAGRAAQPGSSFHNYGLAVDISASPPDGLEEVGLIAEQHGLRWGGRFTGGMREPWHIDAGGFITIAEAQAEVSPRDLVEVA